MYTITNEGLLQKDDYVVPPFEILSKLPKWIQLDDNLTFRKLLTFFTNYPDLYHVFPDLEHVSGHVDNESTNSNSNQHLGVTYSCSLGWSPTTVKRMKRTEGQDPDSKFFTMEFEYDDKPNVLENIYYELLLIDPSSDEKRYSITFTPIDELLDLPIKFGDVEYTVNIDKEYKQHSKKMDGCSLYDLIDSVLDSVDFFGSEETKKSELDKLHDIIKDIDGIDEDDE